MTSGRTWLSVGAALSAALAAPPVLAAGFDTPILYTARHQALGGTAIASVDDASAGFHNPAGVQGVRGLGLIGDFSLILGRVRSTPGADGVNRESNQVLAPFFLLGAAYRAHPWLSFGLAAFPVASGGAEYTYDNPVTGAASKDATQIIFFEASPFMSLNVPSDRWLPGRLAFGAGYRASLVVFDREQGVAADPRLLNLKLRGTNFTGFRLGLQYQPVLPLKLGFVFRNKVRVETRADSVTVYTQEARNAELVFTLPAKLGFGARVDQGQFGLATDVEWALQSQNGRAPLTGTIGGEPTSVANVFDWQNGVTLRLGAEYRLFKGPVVPLRIGYILDRTVTNRAYPSAFGTPPAPTHSVTAGAGYHRERWQLNVAVARRFGSTHIDDAEVATDCRFCSFGGDYSIGMTGLYLDFSVDLPIGPGGGG